MSLVPGSGGHDGVPYLQDAYGYGSRKELACFLGPVCGLGHRAHSLPGPA